MITDKEFFTQTSCSSYSEFNRLIQNATYYAGNPDLTQYHILRNGVAKIIILDLKMSELITKVDNEI